MAETAEPFATKTDFDGLRADVRSLDQRVTQAEIRLSSVEVGQKWIIWIVGIILAMVVGNFAVTIAMAIPLLTER